MDRRPNILLLIADEQRPDVAGFAGNRVIRTPFLDDLARTGVVFQNAYTSSPVCAPARASIVTGMLPCHLPSDGACDTFVTNADFLKPGFPSMPKHFATYAYDTVCTGQLGVSVSGLNPVEGWTRSLGHTRVQPQFVPGILKKELQKYGPAHPAHGAAADRSAAARKHLYRNYVQSCGFGSHTGDDRCEEDARLFIRHYTSTGMEKRPALLAVTWRSPHYPLLSSQERYTYYHSRVTPYLDQSPFAHPYLDGDYVMREGKDMSTDDIRRATALYYGMVEALDARCGTILSAIRESGQDLDDWIIVYTSDHGEMLGEHSAWEKQQFFEGAVRVPLFIRWPRGFAGGRVIEENVSTFDLFATLCELAGLPVPDDLDSRSLVPMLRGEQRNWDNIVMSMEGPKRDLPDGQFMIKKDALKYQYYGPKMPEILFNLDADPTETRNVIADPRHAQDVQAFRMKCAAMWDERVRKEEP